MTTNKPPLRFILVIVVLGVCLSTSSAQTIPKKICDLPRITTVAPDLFFEVSASCAGSKSIAWSDLITGLNATTATALAANGTNCSAGQAPRGVDAQGNAENCTTYLTSAVTSLTCGTGLSGGTVTSSGTCALNASDASTLGGVNSLTCGSNNWFSALSTGGAFACSQPGFSNLSGLASTAQIPPIIFASGTNTITNSSTGIVVLNDDASTNAANLVLRKSRSGASANTSDTVGVFLQFVNSAVAVKNAGYFGGTFTNVTSGSEAADLPIKEMIAGSLTTVMTISSGHFTAGTLAPTVACTGTGTSPTAPSIAAGGDDRSFTIIMNTGTGSPSSTGTCTVTFAKAYPTNSPSMVCMLGDGASVWSNEAVVRQSTFSLTAPVMTWTNEATGVLTGLVASSSYKINCLVAGGN